jgi:hypothetical protein
MILFLDVFSFALMMLTGIAAGLLIRDIWPTS